MAICKWCDKDMLDPLVTTCEGCPDVAYLDGLVLPPSTYHFNEPSGRCHDCYIKHGGKHHPGCDVERCPRCKGQLISCGCRQKESDD